MKCSSNRVLGINGTENWVKVTRVLQYGAIADVIPPWPRPAVIGVTPPLVKKCNYQGFLGVLGA